MKLNVSQLVHPDYSSSVDDWEKFRDVYEGGHDFVDKYLEKFSLREEDTDFTTRKKISYSPSHSKAALIDVRNSIYQRMPDIHRNGGSKSWNKAIVGQNRGVNRRGANMNYFIGTQVLPELLVQAKVGVYVDRPEIIDTANRAEAETKAPYLYYYRAEDIRTWADDPETDVLSAVFLRDHDWGVDEATGLVTERVTRYRLLQKQEDGTIKVTFYDKDGQQLEDETQTLLISRIPFVIPELSQSLLTDIADHQIALLNTASSDLAYILKANFPFYTEQYNPMTEGAHLRPEAPDGDKSTADTSRNKDIKVGVAQGRRYSKGLDQPGFIHPSAEPLEASMKKQDQIKAEIRQLIALALTNLESRHASVDSKRHDDAGLEAGLSYIGLELEWCEREIQAIWNEYEGYKEESTVHYPSNYSLKSEADRREEAKDLIELMPKLPSDTYQKETAKQAATILHSTKVSDDTLKDMHKDIDAAPVVVVDPDVIKGDHEAGFVSTELASELRGYPKGEVTKAKIDHIERLKRIAISQTDGAAAGARGLDDAGEPDDGKKEKEKSQNADIQPDGAKAVRGEA
jgi:hypothetical protein